MKDDKIVIARIWPRYEGFVSSRASIVYGLNSRHYQTIIIYLMKNSERPNPFEQKGIKTFYISQNRRFRIFNLFVVWKLSRILKQQKVDIIQTHGHLATVYGSLAAKIASVSVLFSHVPGLNRSRRFRRKLINWIIFRWVDKILTTGNAVRNDVLQSNWKVRPEQVISIGNSIDFDRFSRVEISKQRAKEIIGLKPDSFVFGTVGRLAPTKNLSCLIKAFAKVKQSIKSAQLILIGQGRLKDELKKQAEQSSCTGSIHFLGHRDNIAELLKAMDIFVLSSLAEGMPRSLLEAMASEVPCIATNIGGVPEILVDGEFGYLVPSDNFDALATVMVNINQIGHKQLQLFAQKAKQHVLEKYSHEVIIKKLEKLYHKQLSSKWSFSEYLKYGIDLVTIEKKSLPVEQLNIQYNPDRFEGYKSLHKGPEDSVLDMAFSPHCGLLRAYEKEGKRIWPNIKRFDYYKMQRLFGKSRKSAISKAKKLIDLYDSIKSSGFNSRITVVNKPIVDNKYNSGYEIYTGHHRVACCLVLGIDSVPCEIADVTEKYL